MCPIVCATRGGKACHQTESEAIRLAREQGKELIFLFVADPTFAEPVEEALREILVDELSKLGRSVLHIAQARAAEEDLQAKAVVLQGIVRDKIEQYVRQVNASTLVIGSPEVGPTPQMFTAEGLAHFVSTIQSIGVEVIVVE